MDRVSCHPERRHNIIVPDTQTNQQKSAEEAPLKKPPGVPDGVLDRAESPLE